MYNLNNENLLFTKINTVRHERLYAMTIVSFFRLAIVQGIKNTLQYNISTIMCINRLTIKSTHRYFTALQKI